MGKVFSGFFLMTGMVIGTMLSAIPTARTADQVRPGEAALRAAEADREKQALGMLLALSRHEQQVAQAMVDGALPGLNEVIARHVAQHELQIRAAMALGANMDTAFNRDQWISAQAEESVLAGLPEDKREQAYLDAALKCSQHALALIDYRVLPQLQQASAIELAKQSRKQAEQRIRDLQQVRLQQGG